MCSRRLHQQYRSGTNERDVGLSLSFSLSFSLSSYLYIGTNFAKGGRAESREIVSLYIAMTNMNRRLEVIISVASMRHGIFQETNKNGNPCVYTQPDTRVKSPNLGLILFFGQGLAFERQKRLVKEWSRETEWVAAARPFRIRSNSLIITSMDAARIDQ